jgi:CubicO group peptidase (beta-lactamase class C family)
VSKLLRVLRKSAIVLFVTYLALFAFTKVIHYPNPIATIRLGLAPASKTPDLMPSHVIKAGAKVNDWQLAPKQESYGDVTYNGKSVGFQDFLDTTNTNAFLVIRDGKIAYEYYKDKKFAQMRLPSYSVGKTMTSLVVGQLIDQGKISENQTFIHYLPEFKTGGSFDKITIAQLLDMQSGVGVSDNYPSGPSGWGVAIAQMYGGTDMNWFLMHNRKMAFEPGTQSIYRSVDPQMIGLVIKKVTGQTVSEYFSEHIWKIVGAEHDATWNVDHVGGIEKTFCCFNAYARDYARMGQLVLDQGIVPTTKKQVISASWMNRLTTPVTRLDYDWGYGAYMWHPYPGISLMLGLHGQFVYIDIPHNTVIVKLSDEPTDSDNKSPLVAAVLKQIAEKS